MKAPVRNPIFLVPYLENAMALRGHDEWGQDPAKQALYTL